MDEVCKKCGTDDRYKNGQCKYCKRKYMRQYHMDNKEKEKKYYLKNRDRYLTCNKQYWIDNKEKESKRIGEWKKNNPNKVKEHTYRHLTRLYELPHESYDFVSICELYDNRCVCCGEKKKLTVDHIIPLSWDNCPGDIVDNIQPLCKSCNCRKGNYHATDYRNGKKLEFVIQLSLFG